MLDVLATWLFFLPSAVSKRRGGVEVTVGLVKQDDVTTLVAPSYHLYGTLHPQS